MFNFNNTEWKDGATNLILGQAPGLLDSIHRRHPKLFSLYKGQKSDDWQEDDVDLEQARIDFLECPPDISGAMIDNLTYQWELDTIAANSMAFLLAPFITDSDFKLSVMKNAEIENLHALTYSEIVRLAVPNVEDIFKNAMYGEEIQERSKTILRLLEELKVAGMEYVLGIRENNQELYNIAFKGLFTFYCLERIQFMGSFEQTFALVEAEWFQPIGELVKKIRKDEFYYHCKTMQYAIKHEMTTKRGSIAYMECREDLEKVLMEVTQREYDWNAHMFSKYKIPNLTLSLANKSVEYHAQEVYNTVYIEPPFEQQTKNPIPYSDKYLKLDFFQNANQESDNSNYSLNSYYRDLDINIRFEYY